MWQWAWQPEGGVAVSIACVLSVEGVAGGVVIGVAVGVTFS